MKTRMTILFAMVLAAAFSRLIPHPWNFTAIGAMALFGGAFFPSRWTSLVLPMAALLVSDLVLGLHDTMVFVYGAFLLNVVLGWSLQNNQKPLRIGGFAVLSSVLFFAISNFGVWAMGGLYPRTFEGLVQCYIQAIPFFGNQVAGDLFFSAVLFGSYAWMRKTAPGWTYTPATR